MTHLITTGDFTFTDTTATYSMQFPSDIWWRSPDNCVAQALRELRDEAHRRVCRIEFTNITIRREGEAPNRIRTVTVTGDIS